MIGTDVLILTDEGAVKRGRRRWKPGKTVGRIVKKAWRHDRGWYVRVNPELTVILFEDEFKEPDASHHP